MGRPDDEAPVELTHLDIRSAVRGATFPATGDDLVAVARVNQAAPEVVDALDRLGAADEFESVEEVLDELNLDHTAIDDTVQLRVALGMPDEATSPDDDIVLLADDEETAGLTG